MRDAPTEIVTPHAPTGSTVEVSHIIRRPGSVNFFFEGQLLGFFVIRDRPGQADVDTTCVEVVSMGDVRVSALKSVSTTVDSISEVPNDYEPGDEGAVPLGAGSDVTRILFTHEHVTDNTQHVAPRQIVIVPTTATTEVPRAPVYSTVEWRTGNDEGDEAVYITNSSPPRQLEGHDRQPCDRLAAGPTEVPPVTAFVGSAITPPAIGVVIPVTATATGFGSAEPRTSFVGTSPYGVPVVFFKVHPSPAVPRDTATSIKRDATTDTGTKVDKVPNAARWVEGPVPAAIAAADTDTEPGVSQPYSEGSQINIFRPSTGDGNKVGGAGGDSKSGSAYGPGINRTDDTPVTVYVDKDKV